MNVKERRYSLTRYLFGALPARLGDEMSGHAILLTGLAATQTVELGSTLLGGLTFSAALGGPLLGAVLDRSRQPGRVLAVALSLYAVLIVLIALSLGHVPVWVSVITALAAGFFMPAISGGWSSQLKSFIADGHMMRASAIDATTFNIAGLAGPALAGLAAAIFGVHWVIVILVVLLAAALPMAWMLPKHPAQTGRPHDTSFWHDVNDGFKVIATNRALFRITITSIISYMGIGMLWVICPLIGKEVFGNAGYGGVLMSVLSVGALVATVVYTKWPTRYSPDAIALATTLTLGVAMFMLALAGNIFFVMIAILIAGLADGPQLAAIFAVRHREAPVRSRSQVFTTGASLKITAAALGVVLAGQIASISIELTILAAGLVQVLAAISYIFLTKKQITTITSKV